MSQPIDEFVFTVSGSVATPLEQVAISQLNLLERQHLQEWVLDQPQMLGENFLIITFEFDQWANSAGTTTKDRLDVLGLDQTGRLVVVELKRGSYDNTVELQALKYAALASRFEEDQLALLHMEFVNRYSEQENFITEEEAADRISSHVTTGISLETLSNPRIMIMAEGYVSSVTSTVVWLNERGVDITLRTFKAYQADSNVILTVSQVYPVINTDELVSGPLLQKEKKFFKKDLPSVEWSIEDLALIEAKGFSVPIAILDLASTNPSTWIPSSLAYEKANVDRKGGMGRLAGFGYSVRTTFRRSNAPWNSEWAQGGTYEAYYSVEPPTAVAWKKLRTSKKNLGSHD
jgi:hypothetical protein